MKIDKENMEHVQEVLDKYDIEGLYDLDQRLFEWNEANMRLWEVSVTRPVTFKFRVRALDSSSACKTANKILDKDKMGPSEEHGQYEIHEHTPYDENTMISTAKEVRDA